MNTIELNEDYKSNIVAELTNTLTETSLPSGIKRSGKVRDQYDLGDSIALITTDRQSAFDRVLASVPFKGQVLNLTSAWWFEATKDIIANHVIDIPDPNVTLAKKCDVFPIEFVVRGFITGSTSTSLWTVYNNGDREYCGNDLPEGLKKNQRLEQNMLTPTTKEEDHDRPISPTDIVKEKWMTQEELVPFVKPSHRRVAAKCTEGVRKWCDTHATCVSREVSVSMVTKTRDPIRRQLWRHGLLRPPPDVGRRPTSVVRRPLQKRLKRGRNCHEISFHFHFHFVKIGPMQICVTMYD